MQASTFDKKKPIVIGGDHAGFEYKSTLIGILEQDGYTVVDKGTYSTDSTDYPDYAHPVANMVANGESDAGILICGSGNGVCMSANKHKEVRAALCWDVELAELARQHNNANVLCIPARFVSIDKAQQMLTAFLTTPFEGGRHERRVNKIADFAG